MMRRHASLLLAARSGDLAEIAAACAAMTVELQAGYGAAPVAFPAPATGKPDRLTQFLAFSAIALAIGLATYAEVEPGEEKLAESALLALQARQDKFSRAIDVSDPTTPLADLYAFLIPHLP